MIVEFKDFINEAVHTSAMEKLRDAVHDIVTALDKGKTITLAKTIKRLFDEYNINISEDLLHDILDKWSFSKEYSIFTKGDKKWLDYSTFQKVLTHNDKKRKVILGKSRKKMEEEETKKRASTNYNTGWQGRGTYLGGTTTRHGGNYPHYPYYEGD